MGLIKRAVDFMKSLFKRNKPVKSVETEERNLIREEYKTISDSKDLSRVSTMRTPPYLLNRKMRRFLKRMGWGKINSRRTTPEMWNLINGLMNARLSVEAKRKAFKSILGS